MAKTTDQLAREVIHGKWGAGKTRKEKLTKAGYDYDTVQKRVNELVVALDVLDNKYGKGDQRKAAIEKAGYDYEVIQDYVNTILKTDKDRTREEIIEDMTYWAVKIAADNRYHYNLWKGNIKQSHLCPICSGLKFEDDKEHFGWNCIGFTAAVWRHGGRLGNICKCGWVSCPDGNAEYLLTKPEAEALKLAKKYTGLNDIKLIRNKNGIPKSEWQAGDICFRYSGNTCNHLFWYKGGGKVIDSCGSSGTIPNDKQIMERSYGGYSAKVIIRYTGGKKVDPKPEPTPSKKKYPGKLPTTKLVKSNKQVKTDTIRWAVWIAGDKRFHYGYGQHAHHNGCYFCGTQRLKRGHGIVDPEFTYCCNPFVGAAWAHGGCVPLALSKCQKCNSWDFHTGTGYDKSKLFDNLGHPAKKDLQPGDVLCRDTHVALYIGKGQIAEASGGDDNKRGSVKWDNSIHVKTLTDANYKNFPRVHRFNGSVNATMIIRHGEVSERVAQIQEFLDWYYDGKFFKECGPADGIYGDNTLKWIKKFQAEKFGAKEADGLVGEKTLAAMAAATK